MAEVVDDSHGNPKQVLFDLALEGFKAKGTSENSWIYRLLLDDVQVGHAVIRTFDMGDSPVRHAASAFEEIVQQIARH